MTLLCSLLIPSVNIKYIAFIYDYIKFTLNDFLKKDCVISSSPAVLLTSSYKQTRRYNISIEEQTAKR